MILLALICCVIISYLQYRELKRLGKLMQKKSEEPKLKNPPKARSSFVVKRMEERLKEALYE